MPGFALYAIQARSQVRSAAGFQVGSLLADRSLTFWTMTAWDSQESMRRYMTAGSHKKAMPKLMDWCDEPQWCIGNRLKLFCRPGQRLIDECVRMEGLPKSENQVPITPH
jgi:hypothetical protein